VKYEQADSP